MSYAKQLALIRRSVEEWNAWKKSRPHIRLDLRKEDLQGENLSEANLLRADLRGTNLRKANLSKAYLHGAFLQGAHLGRANLREANLRAAGLSGANLSEVKLFETIFSSTNLKDAVGLDSCIHEGPSTIDFRTLAKSWPLPEVFLRGCGLPDALITYLPSLLSAGAIQFYSCFYQLFEKRSGIR